MSEHVVSDKPAPKTSGEYALERKKLKLVFDPLAIMAADRLADAIIERPAETKERLDRRVWTELPYIRSLLPPGLFHGKDNISITPPPEWDQLRDGSWVREMFVRPFFNDRHKRGIVEDGPWAEESIYHRMQHFTELQRERMAPYLDTYDTYLEHGLADTFDNLSEHMTRNARDVYSLPESYASFVLMHAETNSMFDNVFMPVGAYGTSAARDIAKTAVFMMEATGPSVRDELHDATTNNSELLKDFTARGNDRRQGPDDRSTLSTLHEGVLSIAQVISLLTADKVEGYDNHRELIHDIVSFGLVEKVTRLVPVGFVGPAVMSGRYFPSPIERREDGSLDLSDAFTAKLAQARFVRHARLRDSKVQGVYNPARSGLGLTCPVSGKDAGIRAFANTFDLALQLTADTGMDNVPNV